LLFFVALIALKAKIRRFGNKEEEEKEREERTLGVPARADFAATPRYIFNLYIIVITSSWHPRRNEYTF